MCSFEKVSFFWFRALFGIRECQTSGLRKSSTGNFIWVSGSSCGVSLFFVGFFWLCLFLLVFSSDYWITTFRRFNGLVCLMPACSARLKKPLSLFWYKPPTIKFYLWYLTLETFCTTVWYLLPSCKRIRDGVRGTGSNSCMRKFGYLVSDDLIVVEVVCYSGGLERSVWRRVVSD